MWFKSSVGVAVGEMVYNGREWSRAVLAKRQDAEEARRSEVEHQEWADNGKKRARQRVSGLRRPGSPLSSFTISDERRGGECES